MGLGSRRRRAGITLVEIAFVVAILGIMAALGAMLMRETIPSWRTRRAAYEFNASLQLARDMAARDGLQYRVLVESYDGSLDADSSSIGRWVVQRGNAATESTTFDTLPLDIDGGIGENGTYDITYTTDGSNPNGLKWVSIAEPETATTGIVLSPRGWVDNPISDFDSGGNIVVTFVNKRARLGGSTDEREVKITRGGMARIFHKTANYTEGSIGYEATSNTAASSGSGYRGGS